VVHCGGEALLGGSFVVIAAAVLFLCSLFYLFWPHGVKELIGRAMVLSLGLLAVYAVFIWLWADRIGRALTGGLLILFIVVTLARSRKSV
jgi:hypothetical protein